MTTARRLSHPERRDRRRQIAEAIVAGKSMTDAAIEFGVSFATVGHACDEHGVSREIRRVGTRGLDGLARRETLQTRVTREQWANTDWSLRDKDIAAILGVSRERVRQIRKILRKDKAKFHRNNGTGIFLRRWLESVAASVSSLTLPQLVDLCPQKTTYATLKKIVTEMGLVPAPFISLDKLITKDNLASFVTVTGERGCWEWNLGCHKAGYGSVGGRGKKEYAHRFVFELFNGPLPDGKWCLHDCDNPKCVNPEHLYAGTAADNARDRMVRGRDNSRVLSMDQAITIRERFAKGDRVKEMADEFGVSIGVIYEIVRGRSYRDYASAV